MMTRVAVALLALSAVCSFGAFALPVARPATTTTAVPDVKQQEESPEMQLSYSRYLHEIVQALETDQDFKDKLQKAEQVDIRVRSYSHKYRALICTDR